jgi:predicted peptidase
MMNKLLFISVLLFISCGEPDNNDPVLPPVTTPSNPSEKITWATGYPKIVQGATSADLIIKTDKDAKIYWFISSDSLNPDAGDIKEHALKPVDSRIKLNGINEVTANEETIENILGLNQHTKYFVYLLAVNKNDSLSTTEKIKTNFITYYRQDTSAFYSVAENRTALYLIYRPEEVLKYPDKSYPILFFLGGNGEVAGSDKSIRMINGNGTLPEYINDGNDVPMIVMSLQHVYKDWNVNLIDEGVTHGLKTYPVDVKRVYLTGISGGGFGCWRYAIAYPNKLAAIVPISGGGNTKSACNLKNLPIWAFHNNVDKTVSSTYSRDMINAVMDCAPKKEVKFTLFPDGGHNCWRRVYDKNSKDWSKSSSVEKFDIYDWLLTQSR